MCISEPSHSHEIESTAPMMVVFALDRDRSLELDILEGRNALCYTALCQFYSPAGLVTLSPLLFSLGSGLTNGYRTILSPRIAG